MIDLLAQEQQGGNPLTFLIFLIPIGLLFFMMRSQKRKMAQQQALQRSADVGDEILTTSGMFGTIVDEDLEEDTVTVEIAPGTRIKMVRAGIARRLTEDEPEDEEYDDEPVEDEADDDNTAGPIRS
ncbi:MAG TPA: preprotein translocase subunit YajC [Actinomycetota bacterium]|jgi:preprotein translocase subunit YajC